LCYRHTDKQVSVTGLEVQSALTRLAGENIAVNSYEDRFSIINGDLRDCRTIFEPESFSLVIANPPFFASGTGRLSSNREAMTARHQQKAGLTLFVEAASYSVRNRGRVCLIYPANQTAALLGSLQDHRLVPKRMQVTYSYPGIRRASLILVEAVKNGGPGLEISNPLYIYKYRNGPYSPTVETMFQPE
jgi:tRNA1(Val) A37 N6-methylase TrmN6